MHPNSDSPPTPPLASIPARTRQQAMDWSLVLVSQGIEPVIEQTDAGRWQLVVAPEEYEKSVALIRQSRLENLRWPWRKPIFKSHTIFDWGALAWVVLMVAFYGLSNWQPELREAGRMHGQAAATGEWWRLFTATFLHADLAHLMANTGFGLILLGLTMGRYGTGVGLLAAFLAGAGGNLASWAVRGDTFRGLGASGVVMGALGLLAAQSVGLLRRDPRAIKFVVVGFAGGVMLFALLGVTPGTDTVAHFGGFVSGLILGAGLTLIGDDLSHPGVNLITGAIFAALGLGVWSLALGRI
jgi:membrane associated rhomboid family serine protease